MNNYYLLFFLFSLLCFAGGDRSSFLENEQITKESTNLSSLLEMQLYKNEQIVHEFSEYDFDDPYGKVDLQISYKEDFSYQSTLGNFQIDISAVDTLKEISANLRFFYGNHHLEERTYSLASSPSDTSDLFFPRFFFNENGSTSEIDIVSGEIKIDAFNQNYLEASFEIFFTNGSEFDALNGVFVKDFNSSE